MKVKIDKDEWWPVWLVSRDYGIECDVPDETVARWERVAVEFDAVQNEMRDAETAAEAQNAP